MMNRITSRDRERMYVCLVECSMCGAHRGEMCFNYAKPFSRMHSGYHHTRGRDVQQLRRKSAKFNAQYVKLYQQILNEGEIPGHE